MTELTTDAVQAAFVAAYLVTFVGTVLGARRVRRDLRRYCYLLAGVVGLAPVAILLQIAGVGEVPVGAGAVDVVGAVRNLVSYVVLYGTVAALGGASRRLTAAVVGVALVPLVATTVAPAVGSGPLAVGVLVAVTVPYPVLVYLFLRPVWAAAAGLAPRQRLLHWKLRNLLLFVYGMILVFVYVASFGLLTDPVLSALLFQYSGFFFQAGIPAFVVYRLARVDADDIRLDNVVGPDDGRPPAGSGAS